MTQKLFIKLSLFAFAAVWMNVTQARSLECIEKDISNYQWRIRHHAALPSILDAMPNEVIEACVILSGVGKLPLNLIRYKELAVSVNGSDYVTNTPLTIREGDKIAFRIKVASNYRRNYGIKLTFEETDKDRRKKIYRVNWNIQTVNTSRQSKTWHVGPSHIYREVSEVLPQLVAGDTILLEENASYAPFDAKFISGTQDQPIRIIGNTKVAENRPVFSGGVEKYNWTINLKGSHHWTIENIIIQDGGVCFRNEAHHTTLKKVLIQRCSTAVLGTDFHSGSLTILNSEITQSGGKKPGRSWGHGIYIASDQHRYPGSLFTLRKNFIHDNKGNNIKSRSQNTLIENNWIESGRDVQARYLIELIGYDGHFDFHGQQHRVRNNIMLHRAPGLGSRVGGDGNSGSQGDAVFENNFLLIESGYTRTIVRTFQGLRSLKLIKNTLGFIDEPENVILVTDELEASQWVKAHPVITIQKNVITEDTKVLKRNYSAGGKNTMVGINVKDNISTSPLLIDKEDVVQSRPTEREYIYKIGF